MNMNEEAGEAWEDPPLHRHLSTVGIGPVFICPPPHSPSSSSSQKQSWEIVGDIKSSPEDFIVREIGWAPPPSGSVGREGGDDEKIKYSTNEYIKRREWSRQIAGLGEYSYASASAEGKIDEMNEEGNSEDIKHTQNEMGDSEVDHRDAMPAAKKTRNAYIKETDPSLESTNQSPAKAQARDVQSGVVSSSSTNGIVMQNPVEGLKRILIHCHRHNSQKAGDDKRGSYSSDETAPEAAANDTLQQLKDLQNLALEEIESASHKRVERNDSAHNKVWIPTSQLFQNASALNFNGKDDYKHLHRCLRQAFPLLRTESSPVGPSNAANGCEKEDDARCDSNEIEKHGWVFALIDYTFFPLIPYLSNPCQDLLLLYKFRNDGPMPAMMKGGGNRNRSKHHKRKKNKKNTEEGESQKGEQFTERGDVPKSNDTSTKGLVLLRLLPDLPRSERGTIHQILASGRRFDTSTRHDVPLDYADENSKRTSAIEVRWSFNAIHASQKKRKRADQVGNGGHLENGSNITAIFCVLQKEQCEHQVAVQRVVQALRCRSGDVGLAGIKDMQAITYQFATLRNVDLKRAQRANGSLGKRVQLSCFGEVKDFLLDRGKLIGNRFEITIRNLKRVQQLHTIGDVSWKERFVPVCSSHINDMVKRIRDSGGFINFYGEQRVGDAGLSSYVGVRSFDVGRAMLKRDFSKAVDLIMTGRSNQVYCPGTEEVNARNIWKTSGGDARATLKAFPNNRGTMVRERDLMKGLLRYGDPLEAMRCLPYSSRLFWIHGYQSYVWNQVATERVRRFGLLPVKGDLYLVSGGDEDGRSVDVQVVSDPCSVDISQIVLPVSSCAL